MISCETLITDSFESHGLPFHPRMLGSEIVRQLLRRLADHLEAPSESPSQCLIGLERLRAQPAAGPDQVVGLGHDVAKVLTRLEGHPPLQPGYEDR